MNSIHDMFLGNFYGLGLKPTQSAAYVFIVIINLCDNLCIKRKDQVLL